MRNALNIIFYAIMRNGLLCMSKRECKGEIRGVNTVKMPLNKSLINQFVIKEVKYDKRSKRNKYFQGIY